MFRLLVKLTLAGAAAAAIWTWVPISGRTLAERWHASRSAGAFVRNGWRELAGATPSPRTRSGARSQARDPKAAAPERPVERHTDADRRALDRIVSERLESTR
jgi:hypothetical protein